MTVIKENKSHFIKTGSAQGSDTESLHLGSASASDTESVNNESTRPRLFQRLQFKVTDLDEPVHLKKSSGKKKLRRYQNRCILQTLHEEDDDDENLMVVIVDAYKSPLTRLLEDPNAMAFWNNFIEKSEEEQSDILNSFSQQYRKDKADCDKPTEPHVGRVSSHVKRTFKTKKNLSIEAVRDCEFQLLEFFNTAPLEICVKTPSTSFDRLLLKAIAQYHDLQFKCIYSPNKNLKPSVEIFNTKENWVPANCFLTDFIKKLK